MLKIGAQSLIKQYVNGWEENNLEKILGCLSKDCLIIESHGPIYRGKDSVKNWFAYWLKGKGKVLKWNIKDIYFLKNQNIAFFEWYFACVVEGKKHVLPGISIVKFKNSKISFIHEYRMTKNAYDWKEDKLMSD